MGGNSAYCSEILSGLVVWGDFLLWFLLILSCGFRGAGGDIRKLLGAMVRDIVSWSEGVAYELLRWWLGKIFNRSPIALKIWGSKN